MYGLLRHLLPCVASRYSRFARGRPREGRTERRSERKFAQVEDFRRTISRGAPVPKGVKPTRCVHKQSAINCGVVASRVLLRHTQRLSLINQPQQGQPLLVKSTALTHHIVCTNRSLEPLYVLATVLHSAPPAARSSRPSPWCPASAGHHGTSKHRVFTKYGDLKSVISPATFPGTGNTRAVSGLFSLKASAATSRINAASLC